MKATRKDISILICVIVAIIYALLLAQIPELLFRDRDNYLRYADRPSHVFNENLKFGFLYAISNEPLFLAANYLLGLIFDPLLIPTIFAFITCFTLSFFLMKETKGFFLKIIALLYTFFIPFLFHLQLVTLRQGFAVSIFLIITMLTKDKKVWLRASFILGFVHTSFLIVFAFLFLEYILKNKDYKLKIVIYIITSVGMALSILFIGSLLGARQTEVYENAQTSASGLSFLLYLSLLFLLLSRGEEYLNTCPYSSIAILGLTCYTSLYFTSPISGRLIATFLPFIFVSLFRTKKMLSYIYILIFLVLNFYIFEKAISSNSLQL